MLCLTLDSQVQLWFKGILKDSLSFILPLCGCLHTQTRSVGFTQVQTDSTMIPSHPMTLIYSDKDELNEASRSEPVNITWLLKHLPTKIGDSIKVDNESEIKITCTIMITLATIMLLCEWKYQFSYQVQVAHSVQQLSDSMSRHLWGLAVGCREKLMSTQSQCYTMVLALVPGILC